MQKNKTKQKLQFTELQAHLYQLKVTVIQFASAVLLCTA